MRKKSTSCIKTPTRRMVNAMRTNAKQIINDTQQKTEPKRQEKQARLVGNCQHIHISGTPY